MLPLRITWNLVVDQGKLAKRVMC